jgi:hypothetical protein
MSRPSMLSISPSLTFADRERAIEMLRYLAERLRGDE